MYIHIYIYIYIYTLFRAAALEGKFNRCSRAKTYFRSIGVGTFARNPGWRLRWPPTTPGSRWPPTSDMNINIRPFYMRLRAEGKHIICPAGLLLRPTAAHLAGGSKPASKISENFHS